LQENGYGIKAGRYAHRVAYEEAFGEIPWTLVVRHKCDVRNCINPDHLEVGTYKQNTADAISRGRFIKPPVMFGESNPNAKLTEESVRDIYLSKDSHASAGRRHGVTAEMVGLIRRNKAWQQVTADLVMRE
jgi:hypothetical protein